MFGGDDTANFKKALAVESVNEFWKRWHISLTSWFRDHLYIPLGGNKTGNAHWIGNILTVFLISGLWHGANYTFIIWGAIHGLIYLVENKFRKASRYRPRWSWAGIALTFFIVSIAWVFFRSPNLEIASTVLKSAFFSGAGKDWLTIPLHLALLVPVFIVLDHGIIRQNIQHTMERFSGSQRWALYTFFIISLLWMSGAQAHPFIYFRF